MPKVSVYSTGSPDYLLDVVADGMVRLLGRESVHIRYNRIDAPAAKFDHLFARFNEENRFGFEDTDLLVCSIRCPLADLDRWVREVGRPVAIVDGEDDTVIRDAYRRRGRAYLKREYLPQRAYMPDVLPLPMGAIPEDLPPAEERTTPVFYAGRDNSEIRVACRRILAARGYVHLEDHYSKGDYNRMISKAKIGVSARGVGWDTYRYWETPYFGALLLSQEVGLVIPGDFQPDREAVYFRSPEEMALKIDQLLYDPGRLEGIAQAGREAVLSRHLSKHRAERVLEACGLR